MKTQRLALLFTFTLLLLNLTGVRAQDVGIEKSDDHIRSLQRKGPVQMIVQLSPLQSRLGDDLTLEIRVSAQDKVEVLMPELGDGLEGFDLVDLYLPPEEIDADGNTQYLQRYTLLPKYSGKQSIPEILVEFVDRRPGQKAAPDGLDAYEFFSDRLDFEVAAIESAMTSPQLKPPIRDLPLPPVVEKPKWPIFAWSFFAILIIAPIAIVLIRKYLRAARKRSAYDIANNRLSKLLKKFGDHPAFEQLDAYYVELSGIVRQYVEDRFELRAPELTSEEFIEQLSNSPDFSQDHRAILNGFLRQADLVKFAHQQPSPESTSNAVKSIQTFLAETRENAPLLEVDEEGRGISRSDASSNSSKEAA